MLDTNQIDDGGAEDSAPISIGARTCSVTVIVRQHAPDCQYDPAKHEKTKGKCRCPKSLRIYEGDGAGKNRRISAKTRKWSEAEKLAQRYRDGWDPDKKRIAELEDRLSEKQAVESVSLVDAVYAFDRDQVARLGDNNTVKMRRSLLGHIEAEKDKNGKETGEKIARLPGHLFRWVKDYNDRQPEAKRIVNVQQLTDEVILEWRNSWTFGSDLTRRQRWNMVRTFIKFCLRRKWLKEDPTAHVMQFPVAKGNRTAVFTEEQYAAILHAIEEYDPENLPELTRRNWRTRLRAFVELLRWSGMAPIDAIHFRPEQIDGNGVLRYQRHKTGVLAIVPLPERILELLRDVPLEADSVSADMPFRVSVGGNKLSQEKSNVHLWQDRMNVVFTKAGIESVTTEHGRKRKPHLYMLRDTCAVSMIVRGVPLRNVSRALGHASTLQTERSYLPWVQSMDQAHVESVKRALESAGK
jgi:integrase